MKLAHGPAPDAIVGVPQAAHRAGLRSGASAHGKGCDRVHGDGTDGPREALNIEAAVEVKGAASLQMDPDPGAADVDVQVIDRPETEVDAAGEGPGQVMDRTRAAAVGIDPIGFAAVGIDRSLPVEGRGYRRDASVGPPDARSWRLQRRTARPRHRR